jgi:hypothetical protein
MKLGKILCSDIINSKMDDVTNDLHNEKVDLIDRYLEDYCDNILYDIVVDTMEQFDSTSLIYYIIIDL